MEREELEEGAVLLRGFAAAEAPLLITDLMRVAEAAAFRRLIDAGGSVLVIEHNLDVIKTADWIIDMGPEGGSRGGKIIAEGTPEQIAQTPGSHTGEWLRKVLAKSPHLS